MKFYNIVKGSCPRYLKKFLPCKQRSYNTEHSDQFRDFKANTIFFKNTFLPYCVWELNKLDRSITKSASISIFKYCLLKFIRPKGHSIYNIFDPTGLKLLTRLRVNFSHQREHIFRHNFLDTINHLCSCNNLEIESINHYLLQFPFYTHFRKTLLDNIADIMGIPLTLTDDNLIRLILYGDDNLSTKLNTSILKYTIIFLKHPKGLMVPFFSAIKSSSSSYIFVSFTYMYSACWLGLSNTCHYLLILLSLGFFYPCKSGGLELFVPAVYIS